MKRDGWHTLRDGDRVTLTRRLPARFDVAATAAFPPARAVRLAHQVRQDLWRSLRDIRGFSPVVDVTPDGPGLRITAGGAVAGPVPRAQANARIAALLSDPATRARWLAHARPPERTETP
jgi:hypothetical protein